MGNYGSVCLNLQLLCRFAGVYRMNCEPMKPVVYIDSFATKLLVSREFIEYKMSDFDKHKRNTLKTIASTGIGVVAGSLGVVSVADAAKSMAGASSLPRPAMAVNFDLEISVLSSSGVVENTLILKNNTDEVMHIVRFRSDRIVFDNKEVSLSAITDGGPLTLEPGQSSSFQVEVTKIDSAVPNHYVWANDCMSRVSDECIDVNLGGFLVDQDVLVYAPRQQQSIDVVL